MAPANPTRRAFLLLQGLTLARIPLAVAFCMLALAGWDQLTARVGGFVLLAVIELSDIADGLIARRLKAVTRLGEMLDPYSDSISRLVVYWSLAQAGLVFAVVPFVMALRDVTVAYCRIVLMAQDESVSARLSGKIKAQVQGIAALAAWVGPLYWSFTGTWTVSALSWLVIAVTVYSSSDYVRGALSALHKGNSLTRIS